VIMEQEKNDEFGGKPAVPKTKPKNRSVRLTFHSICLNVVL